MIRRLISKKCYIGGCGLEKEKIMTRRSIATFLIIVMIIGLSEIEVKASGLLGSEEYDLSKCVLYAQDNSEAIIINASNVSVNGDIISGGNITINSQGKNVNGTVYDTQDIYSNAKVTIYSGDISSKPIIYNVPIGKQGTRWYVFEIKDKKLKEINKIE